MLPKVWPDIKQRCLTALWVGVVSCTSARYERSECCKAEIKKNKDKVEPVFHYHLNCKMDEKILKLPIKSNNFRSQTYHIKKHII